MKTLADEILDWLPGFVADEPRGATVADICEALIVGQPHVRAAVKALDTAARAIFLRYPGAKTHYLVPLDFLSRERGACANCRVVFDQPRGRKGRICCGRSCAVAWTWKRPEVAENRKIAMLAQRATPQARAKIVEQNRRRWADPEQHTRLIEQNRRRWADPAYNARTAAAIQAVNGSPEKRAQASAIKKAMWRDPEYRARVVGAVTAAHATPERRAQQSDAMRRRWEDPDQRAKFLEAGRNALRSKSGTP